MVRSQIWRYPLKTDTRTNLLDTAEKLFAERGFYGVSIAAIADELGLTKQALLHHFGTKEKLYGAVLQRVSDRFAAISAEHPVSQTRPFESLRGYLTAILGRTKLDHLQTQLLVRELMDNQRRASKASHWYLEDFLRDLINRVKRVPGWQRETDAKCLASVYAFLGAASYFSISKATLTGIFGEGEYEALDEQFQAQMLAQIDAVFRK